MKVPDLLELSGFVVLLVGLYMIVPWLAWVAGGLGMLAAGAAKDDGK